MTNPSQKIIVGVVVVVLLGVLIGFVVSGWQAAQRAGNEAYIIQNMKTIAAVEIQYYNTHNRTFGTFDQMIKEGMLTAKFSGDPPVFDDYVLTLRVTPKTTGYQSFYTLNADPQSVSSGKNHFHIDSNTGSIHVNEDQPAGANDPPPGE